jgi:4-hydroxy-3-methylbut-2-en-1-yl diphosphate synthase IspG/GcpE
MKYNLVVTRIREVPMESPIDKRPVNFHIAVIGCSVNSNNRVTKVGSSIGIEGSGLEYPHRPAISCFESEVIKILAAPDMAKEPFMNIEREFTHGKS